MSLTVLISLLKQCLESLIINALKRKLLKAEEEETV